MNEEVLFRLITENTIAQERVCQALDHVSEMLDKASVAQERMGTAIEKALETLDEGSGS